MDLGLPSGLLWAECNVGASSPWEDGDYYAWGETEPKSIYNYDNYKWGGFKNLTKYNSSDGKTTLDPSDDVATVKWGKECRMPLRTEFEELYNKCDWTWKSSYHGTSGYLVKGPNNQTIFLPASGMREDETLYKHGEDGQYWSSTSPSMRDKNDAYRLCFFFYEKNYKNYIYPDFTIYCRNGLSVRPVAEK